jgi:hypothetical protein
VRVKKSVFKFAFIGCLLALGAAAIWQLAPSHSAEGDEQRFSRMRRAQQRIPRIRSLERYLPLFLIMKLHLEGSRLKNEDLASEEEKALLASGFLTNACIKITDLPAIATTRFLCAQELSKRLQTLPSATYWHFTMEKTNLACVICRPGELLRIRRRIELP